MDFPSEQPQTAPLQPNEVVCSQKGEQIINQEEIPDHFYDSDLASINEKDFLSDNEPPKDMIQERKLLYKEKMLHVYKTIVRLGHRLDKPARFDRIKLKFKQVPQADVVPKPLKAKKDELEETSYPPYFSSFYLMDSETIQYNVGKDHLDIQRLVTSMKKQETAVFELQHLETSKKSGIKVRRSVEVFVISAQDWTTVIDMDCDGKFLKEIHVKGQGHSRIGKHDEVSYEFTLKRGDTEIIHKKYEQPVKLEDEYLNSIPRLVWKLLNSSKAKEKLHVKVADEDMREVEGDFYSQIEQPAPSSPEDKWDLQLEIFFFHNIDDVYMDGRLLKKILIRGVSTAKPESCSLIYYALKFLGPNREVLHEDACFTSDWWEDFGKLDLIGCRKSYLDDYSVSDMLKNTIKRMKPAEIAQIECRDLTMFTYGQDFEQYVKLTKNSPLPEKIYMEVRVYNFTEGLNCFNMELEEKINESRRKKAIAVKLLKDNNIPKALKTFQNIVSYYGSGKINQQAYQEKISALMNSILCHMKNQNYTQMLKLCDQVLEIPKHGFDVNKLKIKGPMNAKIEGKVPEQPSDERQDAGLIQNPIILDKCLYRKAYAQIKMGQGNLALQTLSMIKAPSEQVLNLTKQAEKLKQKYEKKSAKMFKNMFG